MTMYVSVPTEEEQYEYTDGVIQQQEYDGRFGHDEFIVATQWRCTPDVCGEFWKFRFPNGIAVHVQRYQTWWNFLKVRNAISAGISYGFLTGTYEAFVHGKRAEEGTENQQGYLSAKEVREFLEKVKNR